MIKRVFLLNKIETQNKHVQSDLQDILGSDKFISSSNENISLMKEISSNYAQNKKKRVTELKRSKLAKISILENQYVSAKITETKPFLLGCRFKKTGKEIRTKVPKFVLEFLSSFQNKN